jgi:prephenate dehydratase
MTMFEYDAAYQGTRGANSEDASLKLLYPKAKLLACAQLEEVFNVVMEGTSEYGVVPIENTLAGSIHKCYDLLFQRDVKIVAETICRIEFQLIVPPGVSMNQVRRALSHPVALAQCENFFRKHPEIQPVPVYDTAGAVEMVLRSGDRDAAAIATRRAAEVYGGVVIAPAIQDHAENYTRFLLICPASRQQQYASSTDSKTTLVFRVANQPAALFKSLRPFADRGIDLSKLESRPVPGAPFEYLFYLDLVGPADDRVAEAIEELRRLSLSVRVLGTYPRFSLSGNL